jgi:hypothetical protein
MRISRAYRLLITSGLAIALVIAAQAGPAKNMPLPTGAG